MVVGVERGQRHIWLARALQLADTFSFVVDRTRMLLQLGLVLGLALRRFQNMRHLALVLLDLVKSLVLKSLTSSHVHMLAERFIGLLLV